MTLEMETTFVPGIADPAQPWLDKQDKLVMRPGVPKPKAAPVDSMETVGQKLGRLYAQSGDSSPETRAAFEKEGIAGQALTAALNDLPIKDRIKTFDAAMALVNAYGARMNSRAHAGLNAVINVLIQNIAVAQAETRKAKAASPVSGGQPDIQIELPPIHVHLPDSLNLTVNDGQKRDLVIENPDGSQTRVRRRDPR